MLSFWREKRVLVTGGAGFIGTYLINGLRRRGLKESNIVVVRSSSCDLRHIKNCEDAVKGSNIIIHLAAPTGGITYSRAHPASQYRDCSLININLLEAAREAKIEKFIALGNLLAYPALASSPLQEENLHNGAIANTHLGVGLAKRDMVSLAEMYFYEYGLNVVNVLSANAYGPGDHFDSKHSHVIPATIVKCFKEKDLVVWGDGSPTRDFLYVEDIAEGILLAAERLDAPNFVNLASGSETSIAELVKKIASISDFKGRIIFDPSKGGGDPRRVADTTKASRLIGFSPQVKLEQGLKQSIDWYRTSLLESMDKCQN